MAARFWDSFDYYGAHNTDVIVEMIQNGGWSSGNAISWENNFGIAARTGRACIYNGGEQLLYWMDPGNLDELIFYFGHLVGIGTEPKAEKLFEFYHNDGVTQTLHIQFYRGLDNSLQIWRGDAAGSGVQLVSTGAAFLHLGAWNHWGIHIKIANAGGFVRVNYNKERVIDFTGDTNNGVGTNVLNQLKFYGRNGFSNPTGKALDDFMVWDTTGSKYNSLEAKDWRIGTLVSDGVGAHEGFTPSTGDNWENVDELIPDDDTTYNSSGTSGEKDSHTLQNLPADIVEVVGVRQVVVSRQEEGGSLNVKPILRLNGSESAGATLALNTNYQHLSDHFLDKPGGGDWTPDDIDNLQAGYETV